MSKPLIACQHCGAIHTRLPLKTNATAFCSSCGMVLYKRGILSPQQWLALAWTSLVLFFIAQYFPIITLSLQGLEVKLTYWQSLRLAWDRGYYLVSIMTGLMGFWFPLLQICLTVWLMQSLVNRRVPPDLSRVLRLLSFIAPWSITAVLVLGMLVAMVKIAGMANFSIGFGLPAFILLILLLAGLSGWNARSIWRYAEDQNMVLISGANGQDVDCQVCGCVQAKPLDNKCLRCASNIKTIDTYNPAHVWSFLIAAIILYLPANFLPIMQIRTLLGNSDHTILGGVVELWQMGSWDLAAIVFIASVLVPVTKIVAIIFLLLRTKPVGRGNQIRRTKLFVIVDAIGHWSMLDVFVVVLMAAMADFPGLSQIKIGPAALSFGAVVILTMIAAMHFEPRRGWQALRSAGLNEKT